MLLAIDTATRNASIALYNEAGVQAEMTWRSRENHTVELMDQIVRMLALARVDKLDLDALAIALGPGSFTGLRVGMSTAKGLALGTHAPLLGIPTLDAVALAQTRYDALPIWAIVAAGRGRYSVARYAALQGTVQRASDYYLVNAVALSELATAGHANEQPSPRLLFCGEVDQALAQVLTERLGSAAVIASPAANVRRAGYLAELAWARLVRGEADDTASLAPMYTPHESN